MPDSSKRENLLRTIMAQPEHVKGQALVTPAEFFDGNDDLGSIGCNLSEHPGLDAFHAEIKKLSALRGVTSIWLQIYDIDEGEWPFSENLLVFGDISLEQIKTLTEAMEPSEVWEKHIDWTPSRNPELAGTRCVNLWWD